MDDKKEEKKVEEKAPDATQAPAQTPKEPEKKEEKREVQGLDKLAKDPAALEELYKNSPTLFEGVRKKIEAEKKEGEKKVEPKPLVKPQSAAPASKTAKYGEVEIKLPDDVNEQMVPAYFEHWKEQGWSPEQVQAEVSFQGKLADEAKKAQETPEQRRKREDGENVAALKKQYGEKFDEVFEVARRAVLKHGTKASIVRLTNSDPATVEQFYELGKKDLEDHTPGAGKPRTGEEGEEGKGKNGVEDPLRGRYKNSPTMKFTR